MPDLTTLGIGLAAGLLTLPNLPAVRRLPRPLMPLPALLLALGLGGWLRLPIPGIAGAAAITLALAIAWQRVARPPRGLGRFSAGGTGLEGGLVGIALPPSAARPERLLDPADRLRLEACLLTAAQKSGGEIALAVASRSDPREWAPWRLALHLAALALVAGLALSRSAGAELLGAQLAAVVAAHVLARRPTLRGWLVPPAVLDREVDERARRALLEAGSSGFADAGGALVWISLSEGRARLVLGPDRAAGAARDRLVGALAPLASGPLTAGRLEATVGELAPLLAGSADSGTSPPEATRSRLRLEG